MVNSRKLADGVATTNKEYVKMKSGLPDDMTPRENPDHMAPGGRGLDRPELEKWTVEELREMASALNLSEVSDSDDREALIDAIESTRPRS